MISQEIRENRLTIAAATDTGSNHIRLGMPNQDAFVIRHKESNFLIAVSDGVGSCAMAEEGSKAAAEVCVKLFESLTGSCCALSTFEILQDLISGWRVSIPSGHEGDCCTTLKAVFKIGNEIKAVSIGDGFLAVTSQGRSILSPNENYNFANETKCFGPHVMVSDFWVDELTLGCRDSFAVVCCTDGVANGLTADSEIALTETIEKSIQLTELKSELEKLIRDISPYCGDDKTIGAVKYEG